MDNRKVLSSRHSFPHFDVDFLRSSAPCWWMIDSKHRANRSHHCFHPLIGDVGDGLSWVDESIGLARDDVTVGRNHPANPIRLILRLTIARSSMACLMTYGSAPRALEAHHG